MTLTSAIRLDSSWWKEKCPKGRKYRFDKIMFCELNQNISKCLKSDFEKSSNTTTCESGSHEVECWKEMEQKIGLWRPSIRIIIQPQSTNKKLKNASTSTLCFLPQKYHHKTPSHKYLTVQCQMLNQVKFHIWFDSQQGVTIKDVDAESNFGSVMILQRVMSEGKIGGANIL